MLTGQEWYNQQASRAVNQALGRVIRHRNDYGVVLLCDERFGGANVIGQVSKWLRGRVKTEKRSFESVESDLLEFFSNKAPIKLEVRSEPKIEMTGKAEIGKTGKIHSLQSLPPITSQKQFKVDDFKTTPELPPITTNTSSSIIGGGGGEVKKFDWFSGGKEAEGKKEVVNSIANKPTLTTTAPKTTISSDKQSMAQDYLNNVKIALPSEEAKEFTCLLKSYRSGSLDIKRLLDELRRVFVAGNAAKAGELFGGFKAFVPAKYLGTFESAMREYFPPKRSHNELEESEV